MADIKTLKDKITSTIYPNGKGAINAADHQKMLLDMADKMGETDTKLTELSAVIGGEDREYNSSILDNQGLINSNGTIYPSESAYSYSNPFKVSKGRRISVTANQSEGVAAATLFDNNDKPIRMLIGEAYKVSTTETIVKDGEAYVRFCSANNTSFIWWKI